MKSQDMKATPTRELIEKYKEEKMRYQKLVFTDAVSKLDNPNKLRETRRNIARYLTELNARRIAFETAAYNRKENND
jgi:large subunit ribosomal protein L29